MIERVLARDFTDEKFGGLVREAMRKSAPVLVFSPDYYFSFMQNAMSNEMVAVWSGERSMLVAIFYPHIFTGRMTGVVSLWAGNGPDSVGLLREFETEARRRNCNSIHASAFGYNRVTPLARLYRREGYEIEELSFTKDI